MGIWPTFSLAPPNSSARRPLPPPFGASTCSSIISVTSVSKASSAIGVSRGCGWQHLGAYVNLGAFYLVGIPVALVFGFAMHLRGMGFWIGMIAGGATQVTLLSVFTAMTNWSKMADKARERVFEEKLPTQAAL